MQDLNSFNLDEYLKRSLIRFNIAPLLFYLFLSYFHQLLQKYIEKNLAIQVFLKKDQIFNLLKHKKSKSRIFLSILVKEICI